MLAENFSSLDTSAVNSGPFGSGISFCVRFAVFECTFRTLPLFSYYYFFILRQSLLSTTTSSYMFPFACVNSPYLCGRGRIKQKPFYNPHFASARTPFWCAHFTRAINKVKIIRQCPFNFFPPLIDKQCRMLFQRARECHGAFRDLSQWDHYHYRWSRP